jgi:hypothetical protein
MARVGFGRPLERVNQSKKIMEKMVREQRMQQNPAMSLDRKSSTAQGGM